MSSTLLENDDQRQSWIRLKLTIVSLVSDLNNANMAEISQKLLSINILRGRGIFCRSIVHGILNHPDQAPSFATLVSAIHSKFPQVGELLLCRLVCIFKRSYCRNNWGTTSRIMQFICELTVRGVVDDILLLQILQIVVERYPTDDSIRLLHLILQNAGGYLLVSSKDAICMIFDELRLLLQSGRASPVSQKRITDLFRLRRDGMISQSDSNPNAVHKDDSNKILVDVSQKQDPQLGLDLFYSGANFEAAKESNATSMESPKHQDENIPASNDTKGSVLIDLTDEVSIQRQKMIYLTIMSSLSPDEAVHKLFRLTRSESLDKAMLIDMIIKCCAQEKTYSKFYGLIGEKISHSSFTWNQILSAQFQEKYETIYQYEGSQLRNLGKLFGHLIAADALSLHDTLGIVVLSEENTTSAGRVFLKFLFQEIVGELGIAEVKSIFSDPAVTEALWGIFPVSRSRQHDATHLVFCINFFTAIGLGSLTEDMRQILKNIPTESRGRKRASNDEFTNSSSSSRSASYSRSRSPSFSRSRSRSRSNSKARSVILSRTPSR